MSQSGISSFFGPNGGGYGAASIGATDANGNPVGAGIANSDPNANASGNALSGEFNNSSDPSMNPLFYEQAANSATAQTAAYAQQAQAASQVAGPTINNATGAQSRQNLQGVQNNYNQLNSGLANTANGGGINAGQATQTQGLNANIAAQMAGANSAKGGYNLGNAMGAGQQAGVSNNLLASNSAAARQSQIATAQGGLGNALNAQGQAVQSQNATQQTAAQQQAQLSQQQQNLNQQQALALYGQSAGEQGTYLNAVNQYGTQAHASEGLAVSQNAINNAQENQTIGNIEKGAGTVVGLAALA